MKKTEITQHKPTKTTVTFCDRRGNNAHEPGCTCDCPPYFCCLCHRDLCRNCSMSDPRDFGDYPPKYCRKCWEKASPIESNRMN